MAADVNKEAQSPRLQAISVTLTRLGPAKALGGGWLLARFPPEIQSVGATRWFARRSPQPPITPRFASPHFYGGTEGGLPPPISMGGPRGVASPHVYGGTEGGCLPR